MIEESDYLVLCHGPFFNCRLWAFLLSTLKSSSPVARLLVKAYSS